MTAPQSSSPQPAVASPLVKPGPAFRPTTAMKRHSPRVSMNHWAPGGTLPYVGYLPRIQPKTRPMMSAPPEVDSEIGTPPAVSAGMPRQPPRKMPRPTQIMSVAKLVGTGLPMALPAGSTSRLGPERIRVSPRSSRVESRYGNSAPERKSLSM